VKGRSSWTESEKRKKLLEPREKKGAKDYPERSGKRGKTQNPMVRRAPGGEDTWGKGEVNGCEGKKGIGKNRQIGGCSPKEGGGGGKNKKVKKGNVTGRRGARCTRGTQYLILGSMPAGMSR